jgi:hypothetical protein
MLRLLFAFLVLATGPQVRAHDVKVLAEGFSWLENVLPSGAPPATTPLKCHAGRQAALLGCSNLMPFF